MLLSYLSRFGVTMGHSGLKGRAGILEEVRLPMRIWPSDVDVYGHLNNGRALTLMDFGRVSYVARTGLFAQGLRRGWRPVVSAETVRFRRELPLFARFELVTRLCHWDRKFFYFDQRLVRGEAIHVVAFVQAVTKYKGGTLPPAELLSAVGHQGEPPAAPRELSAWMDALAPLRVAGERSSA